MSSVIETIERAQLRRVPNFAPGDRVQGPLPGDRGHAPPRAGLRGRRDQAPGPRRARDVHRAQAVLRRRRRAHVPACTRRRSSASSSPRAATCAAPSSTTCATASASARACASAATSGPEETIEPGLLHEPRGATDADGLTAEEAVLEQDAAVEAPREQDGRAAGEAARAGSRRAGRAAAAGDGEPSSRHRARGAGRRTPRTPGRRHVRRSGRRRRPPATPMATRGTVGRRRAGVKRRAKRLEIDGQLDRRARRDHRSSRSAWRSAIQACIVKPYRIPSGSMEPTLAVGQRVLVEPHRHGLRRTARRRDRRLPPARRRRSRRRCGAAARASRPAARRARSPCRRRRASTSSSASSPGRATRSRSSKAT